MDSDFESTLQHLALIKIAIKIWIENDFLVTFKHQFQTDKLEEELEAKVLLKVQNLVLPNSLKKELLNHMKPIGPQIFEWFAHLSTDYDLIRTNPKEICWTPKGTIDTTKSVDILLMDESLPVKTRNKIAWDYSKFDYNRTNQIQSLRQQIGLPFADRNIKHRDYWSVEWLNSLNFWSLSLQ